MLFVLLNVLSNLGCVCNLVVIFCDKVIVLGCINGLLSILRKNGKIFSLGLFKNLNLVLVREWL